MMHGFEFAWLVDFPTQIVIPCTYSLLTNLYSCSSAKWSLASVIIKL